MLAEAEQRNANSAGEHHKAGNSKCGVACRNFGVTTQHYQTKKATEMAICKAELLQPGQGARANPSAVWHPGIDDVGCAC